MTALRSAAAGPRGCLAHNIYLACALAAAARPARFGLAIGFLPLATAALASDLAITAT